MFSWTLSGAAWMRRPRLHREPMPTILIVDDNKDFRSMLREMLEDANHSTIEASDGKAALELYRQHTIDLIVTDLIMPGKEGIQTIVEFRRLDPKARIIAVSGGNRMSPSNLAMAQKLGADLTLAKPFRSQELLAAINQVFAKTAE
jgi:CheY-like chemotaxis protein